MAYVGRSDNLNLSDFCIATCILLTKSIVAILLLLHADVNRNIPMYILLILTSDVYKATKMD